MKIETVRKCPVCNNNEGEKIRKIQMDIPTDFNLPNNYNVVICNKCGFAYADTSATLEDYDRYYTNCNVYSQTPNVNNGLSRYEMLQEAFEELLSKDMKLLDIGVGNGVFDVDLKNRGYNIVGIDPSESSIDNLIKKGVEGYVGSIYDKPIERLKGTFAAVFIFDVLEHLLMPSMALSQVEKYLNENGMIFISVPDYSKINMSNTPLVNNFNQEHINYFSQQSLDNLMKGAGYSSIYYQAIVIEINGYKQYEMIKGYKKNRCNKDIKFKKDIVTIEAIKSYIQDEFRNEIKHFEIIEELVISQKPIIIWGTGALTMYLFATTNLRKCNIKRYVDNNPCKINLSFGIENHIYNIISPDQLVNEEGIIVICSMLYSKDIEEQIKLLKLRNEIIILE